MFVFFASRNTSYTHNACLQKLETTTFNLNKLQVEQNVKLIFSSNKTYSYDSCLQNALNKMFATEKALRLSVDNSRVCTQTLADLIFVTYSYSRTGSDQVP
jgi:hypothetical protein